MYNLNYLELFLIENYTDKNDKDYSFHNLHLNLI